MHLRLESFNPFTPVLPGLYIGNEGSYQTVRRRGIIAPIERECASSEGTKLANSAFRAS